VNEYTKLIDYFRNLNNIVKKYMSNTNLKEEINYLHNNKVSYIAIDISVMLFCENVESSVKTLIKIAIDMEKVQNYEMEIQLLNRCLDYDSNNQVVLTMLASAQNNLLRSEADYEYPI
jgi:hypothetical protein